MNTIFSAASRILAVFFLLCAAVPLVYSIFNAGTAAFFVLSAWFFVFPQIWRAIERFTALRIVLAVLIGLFFLYSAAVSAMMAKKAWFSAPPDEGEATVIVLGAKVTGNQPSLMLRRRLNAAYHYLTLNLDAVCVVTGGQGPDEDYPEAQVMKSYLENLGIAPERITAEDKSTNTKENFRFAANYVEAGSPIIVVTDSFHQFRASINAREEFPDTEEFYAISSLTPWGLMPSYWIRDMFGAGLAWAEYRLTSVTLDPPAPPA